MDGFGGINIADFISSAEQGDVNAMLYLGNYYEKIADPADLEKSFMWYEKAALLGNADGCYKCAVRLLIGVGCQENASWAFPFMREAADLGHISAQYHTGFLYGEGIGVEENQDAAYVYYLKAAGQGHVRSMFYVAQRLRVGNGVLKNVRESNRWLNKLLKLDYADAIHYMAKCYDTATGYRRDFDKSFELYLKASQLGHAKSTYELAICYKAGAGVAKDIEKSQEYFQLAHERGHEKASYYISNPAIKYAKSKLVALGVDERTAISVQESLAELEETFFSIRKTHTLTTKTEIAHFTRWEALESILPINPSDKKHNHLRRYNVEYMNDPMEGKRLLKRHGEPGVADNVRWVSEKLSKIFTDGYYSNFTKNEYVSKLLPSVYTVSFTEAIDRLDLWRAYGADGDGFCITIPVAEHRDPLKIRRHRINHIDFEGGESGDSCEPEQDSAPWLYRIYYEDAQIDKTLGLLSTPLIKLYDLTAGLSGDAIKMVDAAVAAILIELLHLYKDEQYSSEKEVRSLITLRMHDGRIELDERKGALGRLFCRTGNFLFQNKGGKIIIGPKIKNPVDAIWNLRYRLHRNQFAETTSVVISEVKYR